MTHAYQLHNLCFLYGEKIALSLPDLILDAGKVTALTGPNGCGKSTLLSLLAFMEAPNTGKITFYGKQVRPEQLFSYRKRVGFLPQKPYMLRGTVQDNLKLALKLRGTPKTLWQKNINTASGTTEHCSTWHTASLSFIRRRAAKISAGQSVNH